MFCFDFFLLNLEKSVRVGRIVGGRVICFFFYFVVWSRVNL